VAYAFLDYVKIIDFGRPWRSIQQQELYRLWRVFPSDSWTSLFNSRLTMKMLMPLVVQKGQVGADVLRSDFKRLKNKLEVDTTSTCRAVVPKTARTRTNSVTTLPATAGVSPTTVNPSPAHRHTADSSHAQHTIPPVS